MKLDKICRTCLLEKLQMKSLFGACIPNMLMTCTAVQILEGDGLPNLICTQCIQAINRAYTFKQLCEKSDSTLREYVNSITIRNIDLNQVTQMLPIIDDHHKPPDQQLHPLQEQALPPPPIPPQSEPHSADNLFTSGATLFSDIFSSAHHSLMVDEYATHSAVESDLAETMQSLQTIAEQCLPPTWDSGHMNHFPRDEAQQFVTTETNSDNACSEFSIQPYLKCQFCSEMFKDEWTLGEHTKSHTAETSPKYCQLLFGSDPVNANILVEPPKEFLEEFKDINNCCTCNFCGQTFLDWKALNDHIDTNHADNNYLEYARKYICNICDKTYKDKKVLAVHMRTHTGERPLKCDICGKSFSVPSSLYKHKLAHRNLRRFKCQICDRAFTLAHNLKMHLRTHTGEKPHICKVCGKGCSTNVHLTIHMRTHTGLKPYACTQCTNSFATSSQLKKHMLGHTGVKPYPCWQCGKSFRQKETRDTHMRYHNGERPYSCQFCPKKFIAATHLRVHIKTHTTTKRHICRVCSKEFPDVTTLKSHMQSHTGVKPFVCTFCGKTFSQPGGCKIHMRHCQKNASLII